MLVCVRVVVGVVVRAGVVVAVACSGSISSYSSRKHHHCDHIQAAKLDGPVGSVRIPCTQVSFQLVVPRWAGAAFEWPLRPNSNYYYYYYRSLIMITLIDPSKATLVQLWRNVSCRECRKLKAWSLIGNRRTLRLSLDFLGYLVLWLGSPT